MRPKGIWLCVHDSHGYMSVSAHLGRVKANIFFLNYFLCYILYLFNTTPKICSRMRYYFSGSIFLNLVYQLYCHVLPPLNKVVTYLFLSCRYFYWKNGKSPNNCEKIDKWGHSQPDVLFKEGFSQGTRDGLEFHQGEESSDTPSRLMRGKPGKLLARRLQCKLCFTNFCLNGYTRESVHLQPEKFEPAHAVNERNSVW